MKKIVLLLTAVIVGHTSFAQISIDPEIGLNMATMQTKTSGKNALHYDLKTGIHAGVGAHINLYKGFYVKPGIYYNMLGGTLSAFEITSKTTLNYLSIPINLGYRYKISDKAGALFLEAGPQVSYAISGNASTTDLNSVKRKSEIQFGNKNDKINPLDWSLNFGLGYETAWGVYFTGGYGFGIGNLSNEKNTKIINNYMNFSLGYRVKL